MESIIRLPAAAYATAPVQGKFFWLAVFLLRAFLVAGQTDTTLEKGQVSYISSQHFYIKFASTQQIKIGDTLYTRKEGSLIPCLRVDNKSSISCVCTCFCPEKPIVSEEIYFRKPPREEEQKAALSPEPAPEETPPAKPDVQAVEKPPASEEDEEPFRERIVGRLSVASYGNLSAARTSHQMRYTFSMQAQNIGDSRFSAESYITFRHTLNEWADVRQNLGRALKVYSLAVNYDFDKTSSLSLGRKINPKVSSLGAIDGFQFEKGWGNFLLGGIAGTRPDLLDYGFTINMFQTGLYISHLTNTKNQYRQNTLAFLEQRNHGKIDRRFAYFQHSSNLGRHLTAFGSFEVDLYENFNDHPRNSASLTNLYTSLRYRFSSKLTVALSYDNRKNIIYYESYKNYIDSLIENVTRQGLRVNVAYRPFRYVSWGISGSWRFQKNDLNLSRNLNSYLNITRIPWFKGSATFTANFLQTNYLDSKAFGVRIYKDILEGKMSGDIYYRLVDYRYKIYEYSLLQHIAGINFSVRLTRKLGIYLYYEGAFDDRSKTYHRINTKIVQRF